MGYTRANWHSGLTYIQTCHECKQVVQYTDYCLDFRPWYPDGFVYCPRCKSPLRHNENYAINNPYNPTNGQPQSVSNQLPAFCSACGKKFNDSDRFCSGCGNKR